MHSAEKAPAPKIILVTGFEPFGGSNTNASWVAVQDLNGKYFGNVKVVAAELPVVWEKASQRLRQLVRFYNPVVIISFGQAGAEPVLLETTARNIRGEIVDNKGMLPPAHMVYAGSPQALETTLPVENIMVNLMAAGIPAKESQDAGNYLCNEIFYNLMFNPGSDAARKAPRGFIHVPPLNAEVRTSGGNTVVFDSRLLQKAGEIIVKTVANSIK